MGSLEKTDIQGLFFGGYPKLPAAGYLVVEIGDADGARAWLATILKELAIGPHEGKPTCLNLAFSSEGLSRMGLPAAVLEQFALEYQEGMVTPHRQRILGDSGESDPSKWAWGGSSREKRPHLLLMLFAKDSGTLGEFMSAIKAGLEQHRLKPHTEIRSNPSMMVTRKEHFGFHDGISQPVLTDKPDAAPNTTRIGEFLLGYENEYGVLPTSPSVPRNLDPKQLLPRTSSGEGDFGKNGSYLVFRQLRQDVRGFWKFMDANAGRMGYGPEKDARIRLASQCVGRWPSGAPLAVTPEKDEPQMQDRNRFSYAHDKEGVHCPFGSHVRRTNPRDTLTPDPKQSVAVVKRHRILRRGRSYGEPVSAAMDPSEILRANPKVDEDERGLCFICLNADISRQFEFIQMTWINNPKFAALYNDADPLMGDHYPPGQGQFTIQKNKVSNRVTGLSRFVDVRGGAYFFMPGRRAIEFLAALPPFVPPAQAQIAQVKVQ